MIGYSCQVANNGGYNLTDPVPVNLYYGRSQGYVKPERETSVLRDSYRRNLMNHPRKYIEDGAATYRSSRGATRQTFI